MKQNMIFKLGYDEVRKKYIQVKFVIDSKKTYLYFLYSLNESFDEYGYYSPCLVYKTSDLIVDKKYAKFNFCEVNVNEIIDISELKLTKIDFFISSDIYESVINDIDMKIIDEMKEIHSNKLSEDFFQKNGVCLISYNSIIKMIKHDNAIKRKLELPIFSISEYREYIDKYFPKVEIVQNYSEKNNNLVLFDKFKNKKFNEAFLECCDINDVINLSSNLINYLNLKFLNNSEYYITNFKKKNLFLKTAIIYSYIMKKEKNIQSIIDVLNEGLNIYDNNMYNDFTSNIISHYSKNGNDVLIFYYKKSFGNKFYFSSDNIQKELNDLILTLECIDGANNFYKHKSEYLKEENKNKDKKLKQKDNEVKELERQLKKRKHESVVGIVGVLGASIAGIATVSAILLRKLRIKK